MDDDKKILKVHELTAKLKREIETHFSGLWVSGEISNYRGPHRSGHVYCTLKDAESQVPLVIWRSLASRLKFKLEEGMEVNIFGNVEIYAPRGNYQLIAQNLEPQGVGELQLAFRQLCEKLREEGLFEPEHKKTLPAYPRVIGIVSAPTGAALRDMLRILYRRDPRIHVYIYPTKVQGEGAAQEIARGIDWFNRFAEHNPLDLLIVGRGGGSLEDLWAFNEEVVARAIFSSALPVISAVGHEIDTTVADFVADRRAATPSEAAELALPEHAFLKERILMYQERLDEGLSSILDVRKQRLDELASELKYHSPAQRITQEVQRLDFLSEKLQRHMQHLLETSTQGLKHYQEQLDNLSPLGVLSRGYAIAQGLDGELVTKASSLKKGSPLLLRLKEGQVKVEVLEQSPDLPQSK